MLAAILARRAAPPFLACRGQIVEHGIAPQPRQHVSSRHPHRLDKWLPRLGAVDDHPQHLSRSQPQLGDQLPAILMRLSAQSTIGEATMLDPEDGATAAI